MTGIDITEWESLPIDNAAMTRLWKKDEIWELDKSICNLRPYNLATETRDTN